MPYILALDSGTSGVRAILFDHDVGITRDTGAAQIARAALEGVAFQVADLVDAMRADTGKRLMELRVDGGESRSEPMMQFQADLLGVPVVHPAIIETTALAPPTWRGWPSDFGRIPVRSAPSGRWTKHLNPKMPASPCRGMARAMERSAPQIGRLGTKGKEAREGQRAERKNNI
ncbi:MAG: FGGY-family carbohydrate kinase [Chthoniobacter sp.]